MSLPSVLYDLPVRNIIIIMQNYNNRTGRLRKRLRYGVFCIDVNR